MYNFLNCFENVTSTSYKFCLRIVSTQTFLLSTLTVSIIHNFQEPDSITIMPFFISVLKKCGESVSEVAKVKINDLAHEC